MTGPDPNYISLENWEALSKLLSSLWLILGAALGLAASLLLAHGMIPSLAASKDIPQTIAKKMRAPLYAAALIFAVIVSYAIYLFIYRLSVIPDIFYRGGQ
tara:strand:- start:2218 stop:2520 length:303 start_codon:yes stop_codon:yes gene_type:complete